MYNLKVWKDNSILLTACKKPVEHVDEISISKNVILVIINFEEMGLEASTNYLTLMPLYNFLRLVKVVLAFLQLPIVTATETSQLMVFPSTGTAIQ